MPLIITRPRKPIPEYEQYVDTVIIPYTVEKSRIGKKGHFPFLNIHDWKPGRGTKEISCQEM